MAKLDREKITEIKQSVNIVDVISQYVALSKTGKNYLGLCPFHGEKTPSFNVNADKQFFHCFGCGKSGDVIKFIEDYKQVSFIDSVKEVADYAGIELDIDDAPQRENPNQALFEIHTQASRVYHMILTSTELGQEAKKYLYDRGIDDEIINRFGIGLAPNEPNVLYKSLANKFEEKVLSESGLFTFTENNIYDSFQNRIMFPLMNEYGQVIAFSGRIWQENQINRKEAKYKNSTTTPIFNKSYELYNLNIAKPLINKSKEVYLMEGFMDVIAAYKVGITNVVATMGTALTENHVSKLSRLAKSFVLLYDGDKAGQNATYKSLDLLRGKKVQIVTVPDRLDPDEYEKQYPGALKNLMIQGRISEVEFLIDYLKPDNLASLQDQTNFLDQMIPIIANVASLTAQDAYIKKLSETVKDFDYQSIENQVNRLRPNNQISVQDDWGYQPPTDEDFFSPVQVEQNFNYDDFANPVIKLSALERTEQYLLQRIISNPYLLKDIMDDEKFAFKHKKYQNLFEAILLQYMALDNIDEIQLVHSLSDDLSNLWYQIKSLNLPDELAKEEMSDLLNSFEKQINILKLEDLKKQLDSARKVGNKEKETELTLEIINQKRLLD
ncbi:DNA primase [Floricoccus penangensis]|uniref:DNA primase n=1 Tax=Floricoccus penangensis TaxID=1859475 RepID=UPI00203E9B67|nr:DNA primase [Floricoccus penangensis]URZ86740.1 DNA primase [Floricoccus penangensis]